MNLKSLFGFLKGKKAKARDQLNERLRRVSEERVAAVGAPSRTVGGRIQAGTAGEREAAQARRASRNIQQSPMARYLYLGEVQQVTGSSNVASYFYTINDQSLHIKFLDGGEYGYGSSVRRESITPAMAMSLYRAKSKGVWIWDNLRIRGTRLGHRVDYAIEHDPGRLWTMTTADVAAHGAEVEATSTFETLERFMLQGERSLGTPANLFTTPNLGRHPSGRGGQRAQRNPATGKYPLPS